MQAPVQAPGEHAPFSSPRLLDEQCNENHPAHQIDWLKNPECPPSSDALSSRRSASPSLPPRAIGWTSVGQSSLLINLIAHPISASDGRGPFFLLWDLTLSNLAAISCTKTSCIPSRNLDTLTNSWCACGWDPDLRVPQ